ncbi:MAG TPA: hypothetical protein VMW16_15530 [Sedimentisphaerales bacterium]|nr:hypothetical protein [Sedimentisphaerales bacterium]
MELSWLMRLRIGAAFGTGAILIGILAWPLAAPAEPFGAVSVAGGAVNLGGDAIILAGLAFLSGFIAYFLCWPYGREIGILAAPGGLAVWAIRSGSMADLIRQNPTLEQRQLLLSALKWEPLFWLAIVAVGFAGVLAARRLLPRSRVEKTNAKANTKANTYLNVAIAVIFSVLIAQFAVRVFAQDVEMADRALGSVVAQPQVGQIVFAVFVAFMIAGFVVKKFLNVGYISPAISSSFVTAFSITTYVKQGVLEHLVQCWPPVFFSNSVVSVLPIQMVAFGTLGSIAGYWLAVRYSYWRKHA